MIAGLMLVKSDSKRLPHKNVLPFNDEPMFIANLRKCLLVFGKVYVSSDSEEILKMAEDAGAIGIKRGLDLCGDVPDIPVFQHALEYMDKQIDSIVAVHANNPTIALSLLYNAKHLLNCGMQEVMTFYPIERTEKYKDQGAKVNGSIRGFTRARLNHYEDPYKPTPDVVLFDDSLEVETMADYLSLTSNRASDGMGHIMQ